MLASEDIVALTIERKTSFTPHYWTAEIRDEKHFNLVMGIKQPPDYRLLYDSWLWRQILTCVRPLPVGASILELLPGTSLTIPLALQSAGFIGTLKRLNDEIPVPLPFGLRFSERWQEGQITDLFSAPLSYDLILCNHVIDDLLFNLYCPSPKERRAIYARPELCKEKWNLMVESGSLSSLQSRVVDIFSKIVSRMKPSSILILRHYPSTFALLSHDVTRINAEMETYFSIAEALSSFGDAEVQFFDTAAVKAPPGSKYPKSILAVEKKNS
jgi:hypothetical protein